MAGGAQSWRELQALRRAAACCLCSQLPANPHSLLECDHLFCKDCILNALETLSLCPCCQHPSYPKDVVENQEVAAVVAFIQSMETLLKDAESGTMCASPLSGVSPATNKAKRKSRVLATVTNTAGTLKSKGHIVNTHVPKKPRGSVPARPSAAPTIQRKPAAEAEAEAEAEYSALTSPTLSTRSTTVAARKPTPSSKVKGPKKSDKPNTGSKSKPKRKSASKAAPAKCTILDALTSSSTSTQPSRQIKDRFFVSQVSPIATPKKAKLSATQPSPSALKTNTTPRSAQKVERRNHHGETPLQVACKRNDVARVKTLIAAGSDVNNKDNAGWTPLHEACQIGAVDIVTALIDAGVNVNPVSFIEKETPLHDAICSNFPDIALKLVRAGGSLEMINSQGRTPLDLCPNDELKAALLEAQREAKVKDTRSNLRPTTSSTRAGSESVSETLILFDSTDQEGPSVETASIPCAQPSEETMQQSPEVLLSATHCPVIVTTGLTDTLKSEAQRLCRLVGGSIQSHMSPDVTHIVTTCNDKGQVKRTIKYLQGVLSGCWILDASWLYACKNASNWVAEEAYQIQADNVAQGGARRAHASFERKEPRLFDGCQFFFAKPTDVEPPGPNETDLKALVLLGGGKVLSREPLGTKDTQRVGLPPFHSSPTNTASTFVVTATEAEREKYASHHHRDGVRCVVRTWIIDTISHFEIL
eukprot:m.27338 g.27338  ORF g.27338 m.27338 type:complete len:703 (+) comp10232_c0_seq1:10-2118(+)